MARTEIRSEQLRDGAGVKRADLCIDAVGQSVAAKIIAGNGITLGSTGADAGTGDVTVSIDYDTNTLTLTGNKIGVKGGVYQAAGSYVTTGDLAAWTGSGNITTLGAVSSAAQWTTAFSTKIDVGTSTVSADGFVSEGATPPSNGDIRNAARIRMASKSKTAGGVAHQADWIMYPDLLALDGSISYLRIKMRIDSGAYTTRLSLKQDGTLSDCAWAGTAIGPTYGGTGLTTFAAGDILYASGTSVWSTLAKAAAGSVLVSGNSPAWSNSPSLNSLTLSTALALTSGGTGVTALGNSITNAGGALDTIQDIRTTASPTFSVIALKGLDGRGATAFCGSSSFDSTSTSKTVSCPGCLSTDIILVTPQRAAAVNTADRLSAMGETDQFTVYRAASGIAGLPFVWVRIKFA